jgi:hypothetical protein
MIILDKESSAIIIKSYIFYENYILPDLDCYCYTIRADLCLSCKDR